jgi:7-cyano-7-deazaguanine synthase in queuosine biosynthesis
MGELLVTQVIVDCIPHNLPQYSSNIIPVQIYGLDGRKQRNIATIGNSLIESIKRLGVSISPVEFDMMTLALAVTAADTFVKRNRADDGWTRAIELQVSLYEPSIWLEQKERLEEVLHFLSGDLWNLEILSGGYQPPDPYPINSRHKTIDLDGRDCVCLFSGGLDSAIGAIDLIADRKSPLLISHSYKGDKSYQNYIAGKLEGEFSRFSVNANPISIGGQTELTMRTRSLNFLAFAALGASAVAKVNQLENIQLFVPENGFISLNAPLTSRRIGSLSTRTTHPHFLRSIQELFDAVGIKVSIHNPYQFKTKGEMLLECKNQITLERVVSHTVSCSKWKRKRQQCGKCVPCIIRRAAIFALGITESTAYEHQNLLATMSDRGNRDDLFAIMIAIDKLSSGNIGAWISDSGPLTVDPVTKDLYKQVFQRGMQEVERFLQKEGLVG